MKKMLVSLLAGLLFYLMPGAQLCATQQIASLNIEGKVFVNSVPPQWNRAESKEPSLFKFVHDSEKRECFLKFSCYNGIVDQEVLGAELVRLGESLFGVKFWKDSRFRPFGLSDKDPMNVTIFFMWDRGTTIESVIIRVDREPYANTCCRAMMLINKVDKDIFDVEKDFDLLVKDGVSFVQNITFIDRGKNK
jgi:hypothetical protein